MKRIAAVVGGILLARAVIRSRRRIDLSGRVVAITGGSRGLGLILARELVARGAKVAICARDAAELERAKQEIDVHTFVCDVTDRDEVIRFITDVRDELGPIDVLINNAGVIQIGPIELMTLEDYERALRTHLWGPLYAMQAVIPEMRARKTGRIVNISSIGGKLGLPHLAPYSTSKFALYGLSTAARAELSKDGIYVTTVCPGLMRTGSPRHAIVKGQYQAEYAWFEMTGTLPLTSMSAERAARQIVRACEYGDAEVTLSIQAQLAAKLHALAPNLVQDVMSIITRLMPAGGNPTGIEASNILMRTHLSDEDARRNNEL